MRHYAVTVVNGFRDAFHAARHLSCGCDRSYWYGYCMSWNLLQNAELKFKVQGSGFKVQRSTRNPEP